MGGPAVCMARPLGGTGGLGAPQFGSEAPTLRALRLWAGYVPLGTSLRSLAMKRA